MRRLLRTLTVAMTCAAALVAGSSRTASAQNPGNWMVFLTAKHGALGTLIGMMPWGSDGYASFGQDAIPSSWHGVFLLAHHTGTTGAGDPNGFAGEQIARTPIAPGAVHTWDGLYLWAQNISSIPSNAVCIAPDSDPYVPPPAGYSGHLVLDYVPESCNWAGPTDYWLDLTAANEFALPIPVVTDPLQGTRFHLDVYAPVPEPASTVALACGVAGVAVKLRRRR